MRTKVCFTHFASQFPRQHSFCSARVAAHPPEGFYAIGNEVSYSIKKVRVSGPTIKSISKSSYCSITRSGWHLPFAGVAVTSQILCISITLNKRKFLQYSICLPSITIHYFAAFVNPLSGETSESPARRKPSRSPRQGCAASRQSAHNRAR